MMTILLLLGLAGVSGLLVVRAHPALAYGTAVVPAYGFWWLLEPWLTGSQAPELRQSLPWVPALDVNLSLRLDGLSSIFGLLVLGIGTLIVIYGCRYLQHHRDLGRFLLLLFLFMASMLGVVIADDAITLFVFWEATSLTSYLLIGFDHDERPARIAARKALLVTGTGGLALLGGFILLHHITDTWVISEWLAASSDIRQHPLSTWALILVLAGALTKSAQFPFHFWLPAAMAGPTPVSAYLHSATMVKAGVFLLARLSAIWVDTPVWTYVLIGSGGSTMLLSAWASLRFSDMKSVLAYTTTMALGLLVMLLGVGDKESIKAMLAFLLVHALYKGGLFMIVGAVDHGSGSKSLDELSGLSRNMKLAALGAVLSCLSMAGLPPFFGFVGKELSYEANLHMDGPGGLLLAASLLSNVAVFGVAAVLAIRPFFGKVSEVAAEAHDDVLLSGPPLLLAIGGLLAGLMPHHLDALIGAATSSVLARDAAVHLSLWHGLTPAFYASLLTYGLGIGAFWLASRFRRSDVFGSVVSVFAMSPGAGFERALAGIVQSSRLLTHSFYDGKLRAYVARVVVAAFLGLVGASLSTEAPRWPAFEAIYLHEVVLLLVLVVSSALASYADSPMKSVITVGISGYCVALIYLLFGAPDVAMTQFSIETLTVILVVLTLLHLPEARLERPKLQVAIRDFVFSIGLGGAIATLMLAILGGPLPDEISDWYLHHSVPDAHGRNVVNVILVDFRGFDTWGEITVLTIAGLGVFALLRPKAKSGRAAMTEDLEANS
ncbi:MAG: DUF4040 domain-containing protein [Myxococcales bacterium]|nr:DUF4040 domain-containing protein [Myxococcales bacterium]